jgi:Flp pilus assembly protein TadB
VSESVARTYRIAMGVGAAIILLLVLTAMLGCKSAPQRISERAVEIRETAQSSKDRFIQAGDPAGKREQEHIISLANEISVDSTQVDPTEPWWLPMVEYGAIAAILLAIVMILWQTGIGTAMRSMLGWLPRKSVSAAKLLHEAVDQEHETSLREAVAALRVMDPALDAAYRRIRNDSGDD